MRDRIVLKPALDGSIESPGVGRFYSARVCLPGETCIGVFERFGRRFALVLPGGIEFDLEVSDGALCQFGDRLGHIRMGAAGGGGESAVLAQDIIYYASPADGFVTLGDGRGEPFKRPGDVLSVGDLVAVISLMKVRIDVIYDGPEQAVFERYECADRRGIKRGAPLFSYKSGS